MMLKQLKPFQMRPKEQSPGRKKPMKGEALAADGSPEDSRTRQERAAVLSSDHYSCSLRSITPSPTATLSENIGKTQTCRNQMTTNCRTLQQIVALPKIYFTFPQSLFLQPLKTLANTTRKIIFYLVDKLRLARRLLSY
ncbi:MAG: hypothetical protein WC455_19915 [Dehalococcoidia bacterium]|jgi:hypothetical protein